MSLSEKSEEILEDCHKQLQDIARELSREMNVEVLCGHRNEKDQNSAFINRKSSFQWPHSKHNKLPSHAMDIAPSPVDLKDLAGLDKMCDIIESIAQRLQIKIKLGRDYNFKEMNHVELVFTDSQKVRR